MKFYTNFYSRGDNVCVRGYDNGKRIEDKIPYNPTLYVPSANGEYTAVDGTKCAAVDQGSIRDARDFLQSHKDVDGFTIYGSDAFDYACVNEFYGNDYDMDHITIANIDIEVASEDGFPEPERADSSIISIAISCNGQYYVFGMGEYYAKDDNVSYMDCGTEKKLLHNFVRFWRQLDPDIMTGWNVLFFDVPYLVNRITKVNGEKEAKLLSPVKQIRERKVNIFNREQQKFELVGLTVLDYLELYKKFTYSAQESYRLDHIAFVELGEKKLDYSEVETLHQLYKTDYNKFIDYNIKDVELVDRLEEKMKLIEMVLAIAYDAKVNYGDVFGQVKMWDQLIHNWLIVQKIVIPPKRTSSKSEAYAGAYVKPPQVGMHGYLMSFDLNSLYPHLIMQYNVSPDTFQEDYMEYIDIDEVIGRKYENESDYVIAANGTAYDSDKRGFLPEMMQKMYDDRVVAKKKMLEAQSMLEEVNKRLI